MTDPEGENHLENQFFENEAGTAQIQPDDPTGSKSRKRRSRSRSKSNPRHQGVTAQGGDADGFGLEGENLKDSNTIQHRRRKRRSKSRSKSRPAEGHDAALDHEIPQDQHHRQGSRRRHRRERRREGGEMEDQGQWMEGDGNEQEGFENGWDEREGLPMDPAGDLVTSTCAHHPGEPLSMFCDHCEELMCTRCRLEGPHSGAAHLALDVEEAYRIRLGTLQQVLSSRVGGRKFVLASALARLEAGMEAVNSRASTLERDIRADAAGMLARLGSARTAALDVLEHDLVRHSRELDDVAALLDAGGLEWMGQGSLAGFFRNYHELLRRAHEVADRVEPSQDLPVGSAPETLPDEVTTRKEALAALPVLMGSLKVKDAVIQQLETERDEAGAKWGSMLRGAESELEAWMDLVQRQSVAVRSGKVPVGNTVRCLKCSAVFDGNVAVLNSSCPSDGNNPMHVWADAL